MYQTRETIIGHTRTKQKNGNTNMKSISKTSKTPTHVSYIVLASDTEHWISTEDLQTARRRRDRKVIRTHGGELHIDGRYTASNKERGDRHMMQELMAYLSSPTVKPMDANAPYCNAFAHTSHLTFTATLDLTCSTFRPPHLEINADSLLKKIMAEEVSDGGVDGVFAPFAARHVKKVARILPNFEVTTANGIVERYRVEMCILTGLGILVARGLLYLPQIAAVERTTVGTIKFTDAHVNWETWGFDAGRRWTSPWRNRVCGDS